MISIIPKRCAVEPLKDIAAQYEEARSKFCQALLYKLETRNYSHSMLCEVNQCCNFIENYYLILFPGGIAEIATYLEQWLDHQISFLADTVSAETKIRVKIAKMLEHRIVHLIPKTALRHQCSFFAIPNNVPTALKNAFNTCNTIWRIAGDNSTDFNYYSKRGLLLSVYLSSQIFYLGDTSDNHLDTSLYIREALDNIIKIGSLKNRFNLSKLHQLPILRLFT